MVAHEVGHHVQNLLGISERGPGARQRRAAKRGQRALGPAGAAGRLLRRRLGAQRRKRAGSILEPGDVEEALNAAAAIGDDRLQRRAEGHVVPESFTHGTSAQRVRWFKRGFETGDVRQCDTFAAEQL